MKLTVPIEGNRPNPTIFVKKFIWKKLDPISIFPLPKDQSVKYHQRPTIFITEITDWFYLKKREIQFSFYFSTAKGSEHQKVQQYSLQKLLIYFVWKRKAPIWFLLSPLPKDQRQMLDNRENPSFSQNLQNWIHQSRNQPQFLDEDLDEDRERALLLQRKVV